MKATFRTVVFKRAYEIMRKTGKAFTVCLSKAWALYRLAKRMRSEESVSFTYEKKDGTIRKAKGTLKRVEGLVKGGKSSSLSVFAYYDLEALAFRCFKIENLVTVF